MKIFITGTDTGAGKTVLSALLLAHLRRQGAAALAMKPFCSGTRADVELLQKLQPDCLDDDEMNPFYFRQAVAPWLVQKQRGRWIHLSRVLRAIQAVERRCDWLILEGSGGLLVPLGRRYTVLDLIEALGCPVLVAARNRLGAINHSLLTIRILESSGANDAKLVLMGQQGRSVAERTNSAVLRQWSNGVEVFEVPFLGAQYLDTERIIKMAEKLKKTLARLLFL